jgi:hypothetical protein
VTSLGILYTLSESSKKSVMTVMGWAYLGVDAVVLFLAARSRLDVGHNKFLILPIWVRADDITLQATWSETKFWSRGMHVLQIPFSTPFIPDAQNPTLRTPTIKETLYRNYDRENST